MSKQLKLKIVTPERLILEETVDQVSLPTTLGEITVLPDHISLITGLTSGNVVAVVNGQHVPMAVVGGFLEVKKNETLLIDDDAVNVQEAKKFGFNSFIYKDFQDNRSSQR